MLKKAEIYHKDYSFSCTLSRLEYSFEMFVTLNCPQMINNMIMYQSIVENFMVHSISCV